MRAARGTGRRGVALGALLAWLTVIGLARAGVPAPAGLLAPLTGLLAMLVQSALAWTGVDALRHGALLYVPGAFGYEIVIGCAGLLPAAVLAVAILASPGSPTAKAWGLALGTPFLLGVNLLRLAHLFHVGLRAPERFGAAHGWWWEAAIVVLTLAVWLAWAAAAAGAASGPSRDEAVEQLNQRR